MDFQHYEKTYCEKIHFEAALGISRSHQRKGNTKCNKTDFYDVEKSRFLQIYHFGGLILDKFQSAKRSILAIFRISVGGLVRRRIINAHQKNKFL